MGSSGGGRGRYAAKPLGVDPASNRGRSQVLEGLPRGLPLGGLERKRRRAETAWTRDVRKLREASDLGHWRPREPRRRAIGGVEGAHGGGDPPLLQGLDQPRGLGGKHVLGRHLGPRRGAGQLCAARKRAAPACLRRPFRRSRGGAVAALGIAGPYGESIGSVAGHRECGWPCIGSRGLRREQVRITAAFESRPCPAVEVHRGTAGCLGRRGGGRWARCRFGPARRGTRELAGIHPSGGRGARGNSAVGPLQLGLAEGEGEASQFEEGGQRATSSHYQIGQEAGRGLRDLEAPCFAHGTVGGGQRRQARLETQAAAPGRVAGSAATPCRGPPRISA
mmetsp:Transcript_60487/g.174512  ORF Transcript_60487/g.174512 Transcript_60487/m.174512 type:complete len:336 (+) Transcript_60487:1030-2037(+)